MFDSLEGETDSSVFNSTERIHRNCFCNRNHNDNERGGADDSTPKFEMRWRERYQHRTEKKVKSGAANQQERMRNEPKLVRPARLDLFARLLFACGPSQFFADFRFFGNLLCGLGHQFMNRISPHR